MKKMLLATLSFGMLTSAFATEAVVFDSNSMKCGDHQISQSFNAKDLKGYNCKKLSVTKKSVTFWDDNSKKIVTCKSDKVGNVVVADCKSK